LSKFCPLCSAVRAQSPGRRSRGDQGYFLGLSVMELVRDNDVETDSIVDHRVLLDGESELAEAGED